MSALALQLINEAKRTGAKKLDLGRTGLRNGIPAAISELTGLEELILSNQVWDPTIRKWIESTNHGPANHFLEIPIELRLLPNLRSLSFGGDWKFGDWNISGISFLQHI